MRTSGDSWRSVSRFVVIGSADDRRIQLWQAALSRLALPPAKLVTYTDLLIGRVRLEACLQPGDVLRIESPGKSDETNRLLLKRGAPLVESEYIKTLDEPLAKGQLFSTRQWYLGLCAALDLIDMQRVIAPPHHIMNGTEGIRMMFDKRATQQILHAKNIPTPPFLPPIASYDQLRAEMQAARIRRVFIKPTHGSSASGMIAYETNGRQEKATTTVEQAVDGKLFNSRRIRVLRGSAEIPRLIDTICRQRVHVERWIPKASLQGQQSFDVRIVVINGKAQHSIVRLSRTPFTNLHLLNDRLPIETLIAYIGEERWRAAQTTCERAVACLPDAFYAGVDLLFASTLRRHYVLELNAFGDLLPTVRVDGRDTYETEARQFYGRFCSGIEKYKNPHPNPSPAQRILR